MNKSRENEIDAWSAFVYFENIDSRRKILLQAEFELVIIKFTHLPPSLTAFL